MLIAGGGHEEQRGSAELLLDQSGCDAGEIGGDLAIESAAGHVGAVAAGAVSKHQPDRLALQGLRLQNGHGGIGRTVAVQPMDIALHRQNVAIGCHGAFAGSDADLCTLKRLERLIRRSRSGSGHRLVEKRLVFHVIRRVGRAEHVGGVDPDILNGRPGLFLLSFWLSSTAASRSRLPWGGPGSPSFF